MRQRATARSAATAERFNMCEKKKTYVKSITCQSRHADFRCSLRRGLILHDMSRNVGTDNLCCA